jgi:hypothetical protein
MQRLDPDLVEFLNSTGGRASVELGIPFNRRKMSGLLADVAREKKLGDAIIEKLRKIRSGQRGGINDVVTSFAILLGMGIAILIASTMLTQIQASEAFTGQAANDLLNKGADDFPAIWDNMYVFALLGLMLATLIISFVFKVSSFWFWLSFFVLGIYIIAVLVPLGQIFVIASESAALSAAALNFPKMKFIFEHYASIGTLFAGLVLIANHLSPASGGSGFGGGDTGLGGSI